MQIVLTPEEQARFTRKAAERGLTPDQLAQQLLELFLQPLNDAEFREAVEEGINSKRMTEEEYERRTQRLLRR